MKGFIKNIVYLVLICLAFQLIGEYVYTYIYNHGTPRNKVMWVRSLQETQMDYAVLGSSRSHYHVDPMLIESMTGKIGYNFGHQNSYPFEINLMAQELFKTNSPQKLLVQVDYTYNMDQPDVDASIPWLPYIKEADIYKHFKPYDSLYKWYKHIPFYRYQRFEGALGIRNVVLSALGKQPDFYANRGFKPIHHKLQDLPPFEHYLIDTENQSLKALQQQCADKGIETTFFIAPMNNFQGNLPIIEKYLPGVLDYSNLYEDPELFSDAVHLMSDGAQLFTEQLTLDVFQK